MGGSDQENWTKIVKEKFGLTHGQTRISLVSMGQFSILSVIHHESKIIENNENFFFSN